MVLCQSGSSMSSVVLAAVLVSSDNCQILCKWKICLLYNLWSSHSYTICVFNQSTHYSNWEGEGSRGSRTNYPQNQDISPPLFCDALKAIHELQNLGNSHIVLEVLFHVLSSWPCNRVWEHNTVRETPGIKWSSLLHTHLISFFNQAYLLFCGRIKDREFLATHGIMPFVVYEDL